MYINIFLFPSLTSPSTFLPLSPLPRSPPPPPAPLYPPLLYSFTFPISSIPPVLPSPGLDFFLRRFLAFRFFRVTTLPQSSLSSRIPQLFSFGSKRPLSCLESYLNGLALAIESLVIIAVVVAPLRELYGGSRGNIVPDRDCGNYRVDAYAWLWVKMNSAF